MKEKVIGGRYVYRKEIGKGGNGRVFLCYDSKLQKEWAVKVVKSQNTELEMLKKISSQYFPRIVDVVYEADCVYLVMDYVEGITLKEKMQQNRLTEKEVTAWAVEIAKALHYLHHMTPPILYMDCKPENIILTPNGEIRLVDLGSVYICFSQEKQKISGTKFFAPGEQRTSGKTGKKPEISSDIYAYGMTLYCLLAGKQRVYRRHGKLSMRAANPLVSYGFSAFLSHCTENEAKKRYQSMDEVLYQLAHIRALERAEKGKDSVRRLVFAGMKIFCAALILLSADFLSKQGSDCMQQASVILMLALGTFLFMCRKESYMVYEVKKEIFCGMGKRIGFCFLIGFAVVQLLILPVKAETVSEQISKKEELKVTFYDSEGRKLLIKKDARWKVSEDIFMSIPLQALDEAEGELLIRYKNRKNGMIKQYKLSIH